MKHIGKIPHMPLGKLKSLICWEPTCQGHINGLREIVLSQLHIRKFPRHILTTLEPVSYGPHIRVPHVLLPKKIIDNVGVCCKGSGPSFFLILKIRSSPVCLRKKRRYIIPIHQGLLLTFRGKIHIYTYFQLGMKLKCPTG